MAGLLRELLQGLRSLRGNPTFTLAVVASLTLGIGANTAVFTVVNALLLRPLPYGDPDRLILIEGSIPARGWDGLNLTPAEFLRYREEIRSLGKLAAFGRTEVNVAGSLGPVRVNAARVGDGFFEAFRLGGEVRFLEAGSSGIDEDSLVVGHSFWKSQLGGKAEAVGSDLRIDGRAYKVSAVAPEGFDFPGGSQLWIPLPASPQFWSNRNETSIQAVGLLNPGFSLEKARSEVATLATAFSRDFPDTHVERSAHVTDLREKLVGDYRGNVQVLSLAVAFVLLIAALNACNLSLTRTAARSREFALRSALGASRGRLARQLLAESVWLGLLSGAAGLGLGYLLTELLVKLSPARLPYRETIEPDGRVLVFTILLSTALVLLIGLLPALRASGFDLVENLRQTGQAGGTGRKRTWLERAVVAAQVAAAAVLLVSAGLATRSLVALREVDPGFQPADLVSLHVMLPEYRYATAQQRAAFTDAMLESARSVPGVAAAGITSHAPLESAMTLYFAKEDKDGPPTPQATYARAVGGNCLAALGIPLLQGRDFSEKDLLGSSHSILVNQTLARRFWPGGEAIGRYLTLGSRRWEVVGVTADIRHLGPAQPPGPEVYLPFGAFPRPSVYLMVRSRSASDPEFLDLLRARVQELDPELPILSISSGAALLDETYSRGRFNSTLMNIFGVFALGLAFLGVFSTIQQMTLRRRREIAIRMSFGATRGDILGGVFRNTLTLVGAGLVVGLAVSQPTSRFLVDHLFQVSPLDLFTYGLVAALMLLAGLAAGLRPALQATRVEPVTLLKTE